MITLAGKFGLFHLAQQGVHFRQAQHTMRTHGTMTGHAGQNLVTFL